MLERRWPLAEILLAPTPVQGVEAALGITEAIRQLNELTAIDAIIVARGGGSIEELWPFNEEVVARAIYASAVPVVSGVGHETDHTIADFVADIRAPTPSAAAEAVAPDRRDISRRTEGMMLALSLATKSRVDTAHVNVDRAGRRLSAALPDVSRHNERLASLLRHAASALARGLDQRVERTKGCDSSLHALDPRATLARGYAVVQIRDGKQAVTSVKQVKGREKLDVHVKDGRFPPRSRGNMASKTPQADEGFEALYGRLEDAVAKLEKGGLTLEESLSLFEEGMILAQRCQEMLQQAELRVTRLQESFANGLNAVREDSAAYAPNGEPEATPEELPLE